MSLFRLPGVPLTAIFKEKKKKWKGCFWQSMLSRQYQAQYLPSQDYAEVHVYETHFICVGRHIYMHIDLSVGADQLLYELVCYYR